MTPWTIVRFLTVFEKGPLLRRTNCRTMYFLAQQWVLRCCSYTPIFLENVSHIIREPGQWWLWWSPTRNFDRRAVRIAREFFFSASLVNSTNSTPSKIKVKSTGSETGSVKSKNVFFGLYEAIHLLLHICLHFQDQ